MTKEEFDAANARVAPHGFKWVQTAENTTVLAGPDGRVRSRILRSTASGLYSSCPVGEYVSLYDAMLAVEKAAERMQVWK